MIPEHLCKQAHVHICCNIVVSTLCTCHSYRQAVVTNNLQLNDKPNAANKHRCIPVLGVILIRLTHCMPSGEVEQPTSEVTVTRNVQYGTFPEELQGPQQPPLLPLLPQPPGGATAR